MSYVTTSLPLGHGRRISLNVLVASQQRERYQWLQNGVTTALIFIHLPV